MSTQGLIPPQNLIRQTKPEKPRLDTAFYKAIVLDLFTIVAAVFVGYTYRGYLGGEKGLELVLLSSTVLAVFSCLQIFLAKDFGRRFIVLVSEIVAILMFFYDYEAKLLLSAAAVMLIVPMIGEIMSRRELNNGLNIRFFRVSKPGLSKLTTALVIVFIILYIPYWTSGNAFISEDGISGIFNWFAVVASGLYPDIRFNAPIGELVEGITRAQLKNDQAFQGLAPDIQEGVVRETALKFTEGLSRGIGVAVLPDASAAKVAHQYIVSMLQGWKNRFGDAFLAVWGVAAFLFIRGLGVAFNWFVAFMSFIFYQILLASGFFSITGETRTHEVIEW